MLKKFLVSLLIVASFAFTSYSNEENSSSSILDDGLTPSETISSENETDFFQTLYTDLKLDVLRLNKQAFDAAVNGFKKLAAQGKIKNDALLTIADFSQPSTQKRLYVIDLKNQKLLYNTHVAHGRNTGMLMASNFSNKAESYQSSLGFYVTSETYNGKHGLSLRLDGMEKSINDNARDRAIVVHGAEYANEGFWKSTGYLGRSFGCPAIPTAEAPGIIKTICGGSCLYIFAPDDNYFKKSLLAAL